MYKSILSLLFKSIVKVHDMINLMDIKTNHFERFVLSNDQNTHIVIFSCIENLKFFCSNEKILLYSIFNSLLN